MNHDYLIKAATEDIRAADSIGQNYDYRSMRYLAAIAKLLLVQATVDAHASAGLNPMLHLCTACARPRFECDCA